jgi:plastocyanin
MSDIRVLCVENHPEYMWTNSDDIPHTAMSTDGVFMSNVMDSDEKFSYTFDGAGTCLYYCSVRPKISGKVVAQCDSTF